MLRLVKHYLGFLRGADLVFAEVISRGQSWFESRLPYDPAALGLACNRLEVLGKLESATSLLITWNDGQVIGMYRVLGGPMNRQDVYHLLSDRKQNSVSSPIAQANELLAKIIFELWILGGKRVSFRQLAK